MADENAKHKHELKWCCPMCLHPIASGIDAECKYDCPVCRVWFYGYELEWVNMAMNQVPDQILAIVFNEFSEHLHAAGWDNGLLENGKFAEWLRDELMGPLADYEAADMPRIRGQWDIAMKRVAEGYSTEGTMTCYICDAPFARRGQITKVSVLPVDSNSDGKVFPLCRACASIIENDIEQRRDTILAFGCRR